MAHADPVDLAAADMHGGNAAVAFHLEGRLVAFPAGTEGGDESGHGGDTGPGERSEDGGVGMIGYELVAAAFQLLDLIAQRGDERGQMAGLGRTGLQHGWIVGRRNGGADRLDALAGDVFMAMVLVKERAQGAIVAALQVLQIGPALEHVGYQRSIHVEPLHQLRIILLQAILQAQWPAGSCRPRVGDGLRLASAAVGY